MDERIILNNSDVVSMEQGNSITCHPTSKVSEVKQEVTRLVKTNEHKRWFLGGVDCEVLFADGGGWVKGKIKFACEFIPDRSNLELQIPPQEPPFNDL